ncbi:MAG TPA: hypothetical protein VMG30_18835 [Acidobacteriota bacterium]|nr:hypothetical protein [Acidobacteriota bacterium]
MVTVIWFGNGGSVKLNKKVSTADEIKVKRFVLLTREIETNDAKFLPFSRLCHPSAPFLPANAIFSMADLQMGR